jgi:hypothetical protein
VKKMPFKTLSRIFVTVALSTTLLGCASTNPKQYEGVHNKFVPVGRMVAKRSFHHGILLPNGEVALLDGADGAYEQTVENYDPKTGQFRLTGKLLGSRLYATATLLQNGKILITGGQGTVNGAFSDCHTASEVYDPITGTSHLVGNMNQCRAAHQATLLQNGKVLITGGHAYYDTSEKQARLIGGPNLNVSELYDPQTETFTPAANMNDRRSGHQATLLKDGNVLVTGGREKNVLDSTELYLTKENQFIELSKMLYPRINHHSMLLSNGNVVILGGGVEGKGKVGSSNYTDEVEVFNPKTRTFQSAGYLKQPSAVNSANLLPNGKIFILLGNKKTEIYDPVTQTNADGPDRFYKWGAYSVVSLSNGDVLVTRGYNIQTFSDPMELYKF